MGVFTVNGKMRNLFRVDLPREQQGEEIECELVVDTGAIELALPADIVERLRLKSYGTLPVRTADCAHRYRVCGMVELEVQGRTCQTRAVELPGGSRPLLGAIPLEMMDWHVSPRGGKLVPSPDSPDEPLLPLY